MVFTFFTAEALTFPLDCVSLRGMKRLAAPTLGCWPAAFKDRQKLLRGLPNPASILRGSLFKRTIRHRRGCRVCRKGRGHTVWVVAVSYKGGKTRQISIRREQTKWVKNLLANYKR